MQVNPIRRRKITTGPEGSCPIGQTGNAEGRSAGNRKRAFWAAVFNRLRRSTIGLGIGWRRNCVDLVKIKYNIWWQSYNLYPLYR